MHLPLQSRFKAFCGSICLRLTSPNYAFIRRRLYSKRKVKDFFLIRQDKANIHYCIFFNLASINFKALSTLLFKLCNPFLEEYSIFSFNSMVDTFITFKVATTKVGFKVGVRGLSCKPNIYVSWSTSELRVRLARRKTGLSPPVIYFTDRSRAVLLLWIFYVFFCLAFAMPLCASVCMCLVVACWEWGWPLDCRMWCLTVSLSLSHWYPGSGVVLDCFVLIFAPLLTF